MKTGKYKTLYYFTESYPYGISEQWKRNELEVFRKHFERIVVMPRSHGGNPVPRNLVEGVEYREPLITDDAARSLGGKLRIQAAAISKGRAFKEILTNVASKTEVSRLLKHTYQVELIKQNPAFREVLTPRERPPAVLYFYWGIGTADVVPFLSASDDLIACRFHGWDLYEERHPGGKLPFRDDLIGSIDLALPCSDFGKRYLADRYPAAVEKIETARLGTIGRGRSPLSEDGILKIVTCSSVTRVKRLDRLCRALKKMSIRAHWTHIGDGDLMDEVKGLAAELPKNVEVEFVGNVASENVLELLTSRPFDVFVNVSESEGVPVSIMEALSAGIPVYASDVGGTSEIVDGSVGKLLPADGEPETIAAELTAFHELSADAKEKLRDSAFARYEERCNAYTNAERLAELIISYGEKRRK